MGGYDAVDSAKSDARADVRGRPEPAKGTHISPQPVYGFLPMKPAWNSAAEASPEIDDTYTRTAGSAACQASDSCAGRVEGDA